MKIYALCDVDSLKISDVFETNFENCVNFVYKQSEVGAKGVVISGKSKKFLLSLFEFLEGKLDIPLFIYAKNYPEISNSFFKKYKKISSLQDLASSHLNDVVLVKNAHILRYFSSEKSYLPELISAVVLVSFLRGVKILVTEEVQSACKVLSAIKKLY
jgi:hypothetical protein